MGFLDQYTQQSNQQGGGLLAPLMNAVPQAPASASAQGVQLAQQLAQNPTPQMVQQIIQTLHQSGNREASQYEQILSGLGSDPNQIRQFAMDMLQKLGGNQQ